MARKIYLSYIRLSKERLSSPASHIQMHVKVDTLRKESSVYSRPVGNMDSCNISLTFRTQPIDKDTVGYATMPPPRLTSSYLQ
jgi:hypothetical protein